MLYVHLDHRQENSEYPVTPPSVFSMRISLPSSSLYLLLRFVNPMPFDSGGVSFG